MDDVEAEEGRCGGWVDLSWREDHADEGTEGGGGSRDGVEGGRLASEVCGGEAVEEGHPDVVEVGVVEACEVLCEQLFQLV